MCTCHFSHQQIVYFPPPESGLPRSGINDAVPVTGLALKKLDNFQFHALGTQPPCYKGVQAILLESGAT